MPTVRRIFVEKRKGFDVEARSVLSDLRENLGISSLSGLRLINRYDLSGIADEYFDAAVNGIFSEPNIDTCCEEQLEVGEGDRLFAVEYLPGQFDQRADSAAQCVQLLTCGERPLVSSAKVYVLSGDISDSQLEAIKKYLINPVESREASLEKPQTLVGDYPVPDSVAVIRGFNRWNEEVLKEYWQNTGFAMTFDDLKSCRCYFRDEEHRNPTVTELKVIDTYWSDHCRHTTFLTAIDNIDIERSPVTAAIEDALTEYLDARRGIKNGANKPITLMDMATIGAKTIRKRGLLDDLDVSDEINACSIEVPVTIDGVTEQWLVQFKNETHNHPTEIEPFGGAATCLGGAIRDPLSGRAYVYQAMRVTGAGDPRKSLGETLHGKLSQRKLTTGAAAGYSSYGNQIGLATGQVTELYDEGYVAKRMEIGAVVGASPKRNVIREEPMPGDIVILLGGRTGRDGCGGATGSSKAHNDSSLTECGAEVQKGNAPTERKIQRLFAKNEVATLIKRCNDFGAGGVCVAIGELADGISINLDNVRKKYDGLDGTELAISESQERMAVVVAKESVDSFIAEAEKENLEAYPVAYITENPRLRMKWRDEVIVDLSRAFLSTNGAEQHTTIMIDAPTGDVNYRDSVPAELADMKISEAFEKNLERLNVCSQKGLVERFDSSIGAATVLMPFGGKYQLTPEEAMVAKLPVGAAVTDDATSMSFGGDPAYMRISPFHGAAYSVVESLSKLAAVGADALSARLTFQEYFEKLGSDPSRWGKPAAALLGALTAQLKLNVPSIGGKDSMSGSFNDIDVPPTLVSFALAMTKASRTVSASVKKAGSKLYCITVPQEAGEALPDWDKLTAMYKRIYELSCDGKLLSASVVRQGGVAAAVCRMCFGDDIGFVFCDGIDKSKLFAPRTGDIVVELDGDAALISGLSYYEVGTTTEQPEISLCGSTFALEQLRERWLAPLEGVFPNDPKAEVKTGEVSLYDSRASYPSIITKTVKPAVFIPVFPGTNCENDSARAFIRAGADVNMLVIKNLTPSDIEQSIEKMAALIDRSQMIMIPGGFSGGDEPDGSGKFIATTFRNPIVADAVGRLLDKRDGLMLGICNGFQALVKLGLLPGGTIREMSKDMPTLTFNTLGRHSSRMVNTKITSVKSPWLALCDAGDVHSIVISHGEGRFVASDEVLTQLRENGQIATQYCYPCGGVTDDIRWNPNGSDWAIEGITSADGRILGKMGHSERIGDNICKNIPGSKDQRIFEAGVKYFS